MAGAEGERGLDLDADALRGNPVAVMRAVNDEAAGLDRLEAFQARLHPVLRLHRLEAHACRRRLVGGQRDQLPDGGFIRRLAEMDGDVPAAVRVLERGDRGLAVVEGFGQNVGNAPRAAFVGKGEDGAGGLVLFGVHCVSTSIR